MPQTGCGAGLFPRRGSWWRWRIGNLIFAAIGTPGSDPGPGDARLLQRPWELATCSTPQLRQQLWCWLDAGVDWLVTE
jgi:hypothetical protein